MWEPSDLEYDKDITSLLGCSKRDVVELSILGPPWTQIEHSYKGQKTYWKQVVLTSFFQTLLFGFDQNVVGYNMVC